MGDFSDILASIPQFTAPARRESIIDPHGLEIVIVSPLDGSQVKYISSINLQSTRGPVHIEFPIPADSLEAAIAGWQEAARTAILKAGEEMKANQRRIVLPGHAPANDVPFKRIN